MPRWIALLLGLAVIVSACGSSEESEVPDLAAQTEVDTSTTVPAGETGDATVPITAVAPATEPDDPPSTGPIAVSPPDEQEVPMSQDPAEPTVPPEPEPAAIDPSLAGLITQAVADLAARRSLAESDIVVLKAELVEWSDASLGCPHPDMRYKQVPEDGVLIVLETGGITYDYHGGGTRGLFLCEQPAKSVTPAPMLDLGPDD